MARKPFVTQDLGIAELFKDFRGYVCRSCEVDQKAVEESFRAEFSTPALGMAGPRIFGESDLLKGELITKMMEGADGRSSNAVCYAVRGVYQYIQEKAKKGDNECGDMLKEMRSIFSSGSSLGSFAVSREDIGGVSSSRFLPTLDVPGDVKEFLEGYDLDFHTRLARQKAAKSKSKDAPSTEVVDAKAAAANAAVSRGWETSFFIR